jgi:CRISPR-associated protein (TIGR03984 family)
MGKSGWHVSGIDSPTSQEDIIEWIRDRMNAEMCWLLAHADDGVIWGRLTDDGKLVTSHDVAPHVSPVLRWLTLQQAFIFGKPGEVRLWCDDTGWQARMTTDAGASADASDELQILWGTIVVESYPQDEFTHVRESRQYGMDHVVPVKVKNEDLDSRRLRLRVRHFIDYDEDTGEARIVLSRLVNIENGL